MLCTVSQSRNKLILFKGSESQACCVDARGLFRKRENTKNNIGEMESAYSEIGNIGT